MKKYLYILLLATTHCVLSEYCYCRNGKEGGDDFLECEFFGRDMPIEGISLIHLKHNTTIPVIKKSLIQPFKNLSTLYITAANVERIEQGAFDGLHLMVIDLFHNNLRSFENGTLSNLTTLKTLDVSYNKFEELTPNTLEGLESLEWLSLNNNLIRSIQKGVFNSTKNLKALHISFNKLTVIEEDCFSNLLLLEFLDLSFNELTKLESKTFFKLGALRRLELEHNALERLPERIFRDTPLRYLDVSQNKLINLDNDLFYNLTELELLDISMNRIERFNVTDLVLHAPNLREIRIHGNLLETDTLKEAINMLKKEYLNY